MSYEIIFFGNKKKRQEIMSSDYSKYVNAQKDCVDDDFPENNRKNDNCQNDGFCG